MPDDPNYPQLVSRCLQNILRSSKFRWRGTMIAAEPSILGKIRVKNRRNSEI